MHRAFLAALLIVLFAAAVPVAAQDSTSTPEPSTDPCTPELEATWERWLQGLEYSAGIVDERPMQYSLTASYLQTGIERFGASECYRIRADYFQLTSVLYSFFTIVQTQFIRLASGDSAALYALQETAGEFGRSALERADPAVIQAFAAYLEQE